MTSKKQGDIMAKAIKIIGKAGEHLMHDVFGLIEN